MFGSEVILIYLASPYTHDQLFVRQWRYQQACKAVAYLHRQGRPAISPVAMLHGVAIHGDMPVDWSQWKHTCESLLEQCDDFVVLKLWGWETSIGINEESILAGIHDLAVDYLEWKTVEHYYKSLACRQRLPAVGGPALGSRPRPD